MTAFHARFLPWDVPPPRLQRPASRIRPLSPVEPARGLDVESFDEISEKSCPVSILVHLLPTGPIYLQVFSGTCYLTSHPQGGLATRPASPLWTPAREAACSGLRENWNAPKNTWHPGFVENCHLSKILLRDQRATYSTAARVICTAVAAVMELRMYCQRCYVRYVLRTAVSTPAAQREVRIPICTELERENYRMKNFRARIFFGRQLKSVGYW